MGSSTTEIEIKLALDGAEEARRVREHLARGGSFVVEEQENTFFDTDDLALRASGLAVRLRRSRVRQSVEPDAAGATSFTLTLKGRGGERDETTALSVRPEIEVPLGADLARAVVDGTADPLDVVAAHGSETARVLVAAARRALAGQALAPLGGFTNTRARLPLAVALPSGAVSVEVELDRVAFAPDDVEHEVEVEVASEADAVAAEAALRVLLAQVGVVGRAAPGKATRFFARRQKAR